MRSAALSFCICFRFCSGKESCRTQKQTSENHISSYLRASYCFLLSFFTFVSFFYKAKPSMKTAHTEITFLLLFTPFSVTRFAMHRISRLKNFIVTVQYLHSYESKSIRNRLQRWDFDLYVSGFWQKTCQNASRDSSV